MKAPLRTKSIGTKVSEEEFAALESCARQADMTLGEWVRAVLLAAPGVELPGDEAAEEAALAGRVTLAEVACPHFPHMHDTQLTAAVAVGKWENATGVFQAGGACVFSTACFCGEL